MTEKCPTCHRPFPAVKPNTRMCRKCGKLIGRGHKWRFVHEAGVTMIEHRHCDHPDEYLTPEEKAKL